MENTGSDRFEKGYSKEDVNIDKKKCNLSEDLYRDRLD